MTVVDGRGVTVTLRRPPQRIVSLVPSTTETLYALGMERQLVGVTRFCVHPRRALRDKVKVGGTKDLVWERLEALNPELVVANAEENSREMFERIQERWPLYVAFPRTVDQAIADLRTMGRLLGAQEVAEEHALGVEQAREALVRVARRFTYAYLIWRNPWMAVNGDTFIAAMLAEAGGVNVFADREARYPQLEPAELLACGAERLLLSSEPFPFQQKHAVELEALGARAGAAQLIDGELCSWHGVRMRRGFEYLAQLIR